MKRSLFHAARPPAAIIFSLAIIFSAAAAGPAAGSRTNLTNIGQIPLGTADYQVVRRAANSREWERTVRERLPSGAWAVKTHRYTELATGLNYWQDGQWVESRAQIDLLPDGRAAATHGQHQSYFPADIFAGQIETVTPDGRHLKSRPVGLSYHDGSNTVLIAELKDSVGCIVGSNQVVYPDAFAGLKADLRYTYTIAGFEQDVILREQPPRPETLGLKAPATRLQVLTEFFDTPEPDATRRFANPRTGLTDHQLAFGNMKLIQGRAFATAETASSAGPLAETPVYKSWHHEGSRAYLVEEVPLTEIRAALQALPAATVPAALAGRDSVLGKLSATRLLPRAPVARDGGAGLRLARAEFSGGAGLVLDYLAISYTDLQNGFTFRSDTTYFLSNAYFLDSGLDVIEGGTVIKFDRPTASINLTGPAVSCLTGPYRPAIFTAKDDNSVGETIAGSTGIPAGYYGSANNAVLVSYYNENLGLHDLRLSWLQSALSLSVASAQLQNIQMVNCGAGVKMSWANLTIINGLFDNVGTVVADAGGTPAFSGTFLTTHNCGTLGGGNLSQVSLANCLLVTTTNLTSAAGTALVTNSVAVAASDAGVFQSAGAGAHYLAAASPYRNAGSTTVGSAILTAMAARTTFPPAILSNITYAAPVNFTVQAPRDGDAPDLGYHYDPLDYLTDGLVVSNTSLSIGNGVAVACYNRTGITVENGGSIASVGTPVLPNWLVRYQSVQEQSLSLGGAATQNGQNVAAVWSGGAPAAGSFLFSHFATPAGGGCHFNSTGTSAYGSLTVQNSELWGGTNIFGGAAAASAATIQNDLFYRTALSAASTSPQTMLAFSNNLFLQSVLTLTPSSAGSCAFCDNAADTTSIATNSVASSANNAFINCPYVLPGPGNIVLTNALSYQAGPLGNYYQPAGSPLIDAGSTTADRACLFHFTTQLSQAKETNSLLDIGYHYVAVSASGLPFDNNQDGVPDYLEDANGDGLADNGESPWLAVPAFTLQPVAQILYPGSNVVFTAAVSGAGVSLQWYGNSALLPGQTNATLVLYNVQSTNAGVYYLVASNSVASVTSSNAALALLPPPVIVTQPVGATVVQTGVATLAVGASGLVLNYQWYSNSVPVPGATNAILLPATYGTNSTASYYVVVTNTSGAVTSASALLTVQPITSQPVVCAASGAYADVSAAVASAQPGMVVVIPPGTYVWSQTLYLNGVSLRGCGTNQTIILDGVSPGNNSGTLINLAAGTNGVTELSNFQIASYAPNPGAAYAGTVIANGSTGTAWRIDHMFFNGLYSKNIGTYGNAPSVIDHNTFFIATVGIWAANYGDQYASYALPATYGLSSSNCLYIEDNYFTNIINFPRQVIDGCGGSRMVFRHNIVWNDYCGNHGTETGGDVRSMRSLEVYGNTFTYAPGLANANNDYFAMCLMRGGSCLVFSNTASGYQTTVTLRNLRNTDTFAGQYQPYGGANGANPWDSNNPAILLQGTHTGPNGAYYLQVNGAGWAVNQWVGDTVEDTNNGLFSEVVTNSADTMYYLGNGIVHNTVLSFNTGDGFVVRQVYATIDQPGRGSGDLLQGNGYDSQGNEIVINTTTGTVSWPHQDIEPMYFWANSLNGSPGEVSSPYPTIQAGRDFFNDTPRPGYVPYQYPHPLTLMGVH